MLTNQALCHLSHAFVILEMGSPKLFAQALLKLQFSWFQTPK
jgi:hypothetical protein